MHRTATLPIARKHLPWTVLALRWVVLFAMVLDLLTAPMHAHAHDIGPDSSPDSVHAIGVAHDGLGHDRDDHDADHDDHPPHHTASGHSVAALWPAASHAVPGASLVAIVERIRDLAIAPVDAPALVTVWRATPDHIPISAGRYWPPAGRAPPIFHS